MNLDNILLRVAKKEGFVTRRQFLKCYIEGMGYGAKEVKIHLEMMHGIYYSYIHLYKVVKKYYDCPLRTRRDDEEDKIEIRWNKRAKILGFKNWIEMFDAFENFNIKAEFASTILRVTRQTFYHRRRKWKELKMGE